VKLFEFLRTIYNARFEKKESFVSFKKIILPYLEELHIDKEFLRREVNVGFSGGERRKIEILQLKLLQPRYVFLDEVDSGLDVDAFRAVAALLRDVADAQTSFVIITHYFTILDYLPVDSVVVLQEGKVIEQ
jgi:Fe-S cluster assembly ATP-binding protein